MLAPPKPFLLPQRQPSPLAPPVPALLRPGLLPYTFAHFHSSPWLKQTPNGLDLQSSSAPPSSITLGETYLRKAFPFYGDSNPGQKISMIAALRKELERNRDENRDSSVDKNQFKKDLEIFDALKEEEEKVEKKNRWYHQAVRSIAWGPTIVINALLAMFW